MSDFSPHGLDAASDPSKKFSHSFLRQKKRFESIMVTNLFFGCFDFRVLKLMARKGQNGHFFGGIQNVSKNIQK